MARPKQFDTNEVLQNVMMLFWEQGFEATSVQELVDRTGVHKRSMYDTFGDKQALFEKALSRYADEQDARMRVATESTATATETIRALLETSLPPNGPGPRKGCLFVNTATELPKDPEAAARVKKHFRKTQIVLRDLVERGQREGDIGSNLDPATLAALLNNAWVGLRVQSRAGVSRPQLKIGIDAAIAVLAS